MKKKICILAYDALDYYLVKKFNLKNLMQKEYGKTDISNIKLSFTLILWSSFLTGVNTQRYFLVSLKRRKQLHNFLRKTLLRIINVIPKGNEVLELGMKSGIFREISEKVMKYKPKVDKSFSFNIKSFGTIFDFFDKPKIIEVPTYNHPNIREMQRLVPNVIEENITEKEFRDAVLEAHYRVKKELFKSFNKNYDMIMAYLDIADLFGHLYRSDLHRMRKIYQELDSITEKVSKKFKGIIFVIADHGMEKLGRYGDHNDVKYGFYSINKKLNLKNPKITDFYNIIEGLVK